MNLKPLAATLLAATLASPLLYAQNVQESQDAQHQLKQDEKADKSQAKADKAERKALKSHKVKKAAKAQDKANADADKANPPQ